MAKRMGLVAALAALVLTATGVVRAQVRQARIVREIDESQLQRVPHSTHPLARPEYDQGPAPASLRYDRMLLVLQPDPAKQAELTALLAAQLDPKSTQYHKWLTPAEYGQRFGVADADLARVTGWLQGHGFTIGHVSNARNVIEFSGTAAQVAQAFHTEIHSYVVNGQQHWANAGDQQIPAALAPVVAGVATLHNFRKASQISTVRPQWVKLQNGKRADFTSGSTHALGPGDFKTIYGFNNSLSGDGTGTTIAVVARSNINTQDIQDFKNSFGVPNNLPQIVVNGTDPGDKKDGDEAEAVLDTSWAGALAPNATVKLVVSKSTASSDGVDLSEEYIVDNNLADVMTESYGDCEANYSPADALFYSSLAQQAAAEGITFTVAAGDSGAEGCDDPATQKIANGPVSVNVLASTPYNIAVGGTEFNENGNPAYWLSFNNSGYSSAVSYIPEIAWNESCPSTQCGSDAAIWAGGGGASVLVTKPSWQNGVLGIPNDGFRDVPDVSFSSAGHDAYLLCLDGSCTLKPQSYFSGVSGTSAATPSFGAIMALIVQMTGSRQGQAAAKLYQLASTQSFGQCSASAPTASCVFNDVVVGNNAVPGESGYGTANARYQAGVGYDMATGLGSVNVSNLIVQWNNPAPSTPGIRVGIDTPGPLNSSVLGTLNFSGWALATSGTVTSVTTAIDSVPYASAVYGQARPDICSLYASANCPGVGWMVYVDTTLLASGPHQFDVTVTASTGETYTASSTFTVANWTSSNPIKVNIDIPGPATQNTFAGIANFAGWALADVGAITQVTVDVDGIPSGQAPYGGPRPDVCNVFPGEVGCPNVGWSFALDTTRLSDGPHTITAVAKSSGGQYSAAAQDFVVANTPSNTILVAIDSPANQGGALSGQVGFGGWTLGTTVPVSNVSVQVDGVPYANAIYGGNRSDACQSHPAAPACPNVGWNLLFDTTAFVNGQHVLSVTASTAAGQSTTATRLFTVSNSPSASLIDISILRPNAAYSVFLGTAQFSVTASETGGTITGISAAIDGATYASSSGPATLAFHVDTSQLVSGTHILTVAATAQDGHRATLSEQFTVANWSGTNPMLLSIDSPAGNGAPLSGVLGIGGWVVDQFDTIGSVSIAIDGVPFGFANYGGVRTDVCTAMPGALGCPNLGWNFLLDTTLLSDGPHTLAVTGTTNQGRSSTFTRIFQVANHSATGLQLSIDTPTLNQTLTQVSHIGGWAADPSGSNVVSVTVLVDGVPNGLAVYGGLRNDVCSAIPSAGGCPNVGWDYQLDTAPYANGAHTLEVRALAANGTKYTSAQTFVVANQP